MNDTLQIPGQGPAIAQVEAALSSGRIAPTWLLHGPVGTGKWVTAHQFAKAILCNDSSPWGCGQCASCKRADSYAHSDLYMLFGLPTGGGSGKARERFQQEFTEAFIEFKREAPLLPFPEARNRFLPSDRILELLNWAYRKPGEGKRKVAIVYEAELIVRTVIDKLLKLTEEPPADTTLILVSHNPDQIPATIRSRSRQVRFHRSGPKALAQYLVDRGHAPAEARRAVRQSRGAVGIALDLLSSEEAANPEPEALSLLEKLSRPTSGALTAVQLMQWRAERKRANETLDTWAALVHDLALGRLAEPSLGSEPGKWTERFAGFRDAKTAATALEMIRETQGALFTNAHIGVALTALAVRLARLGSGKPLPPRIWPSPQKV